MLFTLSRLQYSVSITFICNGKFKKICMTIFLTISALLWGSRIETLPSQHAFIREGWGQTAELLIKP